MKRKLNYPNVTNVAQILLNRNYSDIEHILKNRLKTAPQFIDKIELEAELKGHSGCVNCLEWSTNGRILASASDDFHVMLWDPFTHKQILDLATPHEGNIFSVKFLPKRNDSILLTGAGDCKMYVFDINRGEFPIRKCTCHGQRIKRLATTPKLIHLFWSAAEDGRVLQHDMRTAHTCRANDANVLINLKNHINEMPEVKCIAINPHRPEQMAIGANDCYARIYDRRMLSLMKFSTVVEAKPNEHDTDNVPREGCVQYYCPGHLSRNKGTVYSIFNQKAITYLTFSPDGSELLVNMASEQIYLYDLNRPREPTFLKLPKFTDPINGTNGTTVKNGEKIKHKLAPDVEHMKKEGNANLEKEKYLQAIQQYTLAIRKAQEKDCSVLYLNRATALTKRNWFGDVYAAVRDCQRALRLDPHYVKAHFRLARALLKLGQLQDASECLAELIKRFPSYAKNHGVLMLDKDIEAELEKQRQRQRERPQESDADQYSVNELAWRAAALDYEDRFVGHLNTKTDIKEANYFGDANYIVAGSDDGNFFIWERDSGMISAIYQADELIVNCVQPHPYECLLATSGIDHEVRLWSPQPFEKVPVKHRLDVVDGTVNENQNRMQSDPFDTLAPDQAMCRAS